MALCYDVKFFGFTEGVLCGFERVVVEPQVGLECENLAEVQTW